MLRTILLSALLLASALAMATMPDQPALQVDTLDHGRFDLADKRGSWVVINYWATWCAPCLKEIPELAELDAARDDIEVIGLAFEEIDEAGMREFLQRRPAGYPIALIDVYAPPADFDVPRGLPMTWLIGPDGRVAKRFLGPVTAKSLAEAVDGAVGQGAEDTDDE
jgi:thiol-disulfide isomerase/thioredoxin